MFDLAIIYYLIDGLDKINTFLAGLSFITFFGVCMGIVGLVIFCHETDLKLSSRIKVFTKWTLVVFIISSLLHLALPSKQAAIILVGANYAEKMVETETLNDYSRKVKAIIDNEMELMILDAEKRKKELISESGK